MTIYLGSHFTHNSIFLSSVFIHRTTNLPTIPPSTSTRTFLRCLGPRPLILPTIPPSTSTRPLPLVLGYSFRAWPFPARFGPSLRAWNFLGSPFLGSALPRAQLFLGSALPGSARPSPLTRVRTQNIIGISLATQVDNKNIQMMDLQY